jgi:hypothetical protein
VGNEVMSQSQEMKEIQNSFLSLVLLILISENRKTAGWMSLLTQVIAWHSTTTFTIKYTIKYGLSQEQPIPNPSGNVTAGIVFVRPFHYLIAAGC